MGLYHVVHTTPKASSKKLTLAVVGMQPFPDIEKTDSKKQRISCFEKRKYNGRRKVFPNFRTNTDETKIVVYRYRNSLYLKDNEVDLKLTENQSFLTKRVYLLGYIDIFYKRCIVLDEITAHN